MAGKKRSRLSARKRAAKIRELILYIATKLEDDPEFGAVRLYKALFYADFAAYILRNEAITWHDYVRGPHGPMPDQGKEIVDELVMKGDAAIQRRDRGGVTQDRTISLREPRLDLFTAWEIALVDDVIEWQRGMTATRISEVSHRYTGWLVAREGEVIPYASSWVAPRKLTPEEIAYGLQLATDG